MKKVILSMVAACFCCMCAVGCTEHASKTTKEEVKTPGGTTTVTTEQKVEKTGDHKDK